MAVDAKKRTALASMIVVMSLVLSMWVPDVALASELNVAKNTEATETQSSSGYTYVKVLASEWMYGWYTPGESEYQDVYIDEDVDDDTDSGDDDDNSYDDSSGVYEFKTPLFK